MEYILKVKEIVKQLASTGYNVNEEDQVHVVLNGVDYNYDIVSTTV